MGAHHRSEHLGTRQTAELSWAVQRKAGTVKLKAIPQSTGALSSTCPSQSRTFALSTPATAGRGRRPEKRACRAARHVSGYRRRGKELERGALSLRSKPLSIFFLDTRRAWASSFGGSFYRTTDGGLNWTKLQTKLPEDVFKSVFFTDENNGWVVGRSGRLAKTADGGLTWTKIYKIKDEFKMNDIFLTDRNQGWAVGEQGAILYTPDAGKTWIDVGAPVPARFMDVVFVNDRAGLCGWPVRRGLEVRTSLSCGVFIADRHLRCSR